MQPEELKQLHGWNLSKEPNPRSKLRNFRRRSMKYPLYAVKDTRESEHVTPGHFLPQEAYATKEVADKILCFVQSKIKGAISKDGSGFLSIPDEMINKSAKVSDIRYKPFGHLDLVCQVVVVNSLFTENAKTQFLSEINDLPFIDHSTTGGVGARPSPKARVHRASSTHPFGSVSKIKDDLFAVADIEGQYEEIIRDFVAEVYQEHDRIIANQKGLLEAIRKVSTNKEEKFSIIPVDEPNSIKQLYMASWDRDSAVIQTTVGSTSGSPYSWHNDKETTHNTGYNNMNSINGTRKERGILLSLPLGSQMRVGTMVLSTGDKDSKNACVHFQVCPGHKGDKGIKAVDVNMLYTTDNSTVSFQMCQVQNYLQHKVQEIKQPTQGKAIIARCVNSVRYSIDGRSPRMIEDLISDMDRSRTSSSIENVVIHGDYNITNVIDGTTGGGFSHNKIGKKKKGILIKETMLSSAH
jgi:hypothetical protein